jgi:hypothetical protein
MNERSVHDVADITVVSATVRNFPMNCGAVAGLLKVCVWEPAFQLLQRQVVLGVTTLPMLISETQAPPGA